MFGKNRKSNSQPQKFQAMYNEYGQIQLSYIDPESGLALKLAGLFDNVGLYNKYLNNNKISTQNIVWGHENENATIEMTRVWDM